MFVTTGQMFVIEQAFKKWNPPAMASFSGRPIGLPYIKRVQKIHQIADTSWKIAGQMSFSRIQRKTERRRYSRKAVGGMVPILCESEEGHESRYQARLVDISVSGVKLWLPVRLPTRTIVTFNCADLGVGGRGTVRYCNPAKGGYEIGLETGNGTGWRDQNVDLRNLAAALKEAEFVPHVSETVPRKIIKKP